MGLLWSARRRTDGDGGGDRACDLCGLYMRARLLSHVDASAGGLWLCIRCKHSWCGKVLPDGWSYQACARCNPPGTATFAGCDHTAARRSINAYRESREAEE